MSIKKKINVDEVKVIKVDGKAFYYDAENALLHYIVAEDLCLDGEVETEKGEIISSIGLSRENWEESPEYWAEYYSHQLDEELRYLI